MNIPPQSALGEYRQCAWVCIEITLRSINQVGIFIQKVLDAAGKAPCQIGSGNVVSAVRYALSDSVHGDLHTWQRQIYQFNAPTFFSQALDEVAVG